MDIKELKTNILSNTLDNSLLIFRYQDTNYLCHHYIDAICKNRNKEKLIISTLSDIDNDNVFETENKYLYVLEVDKLSNIPDSDIKDVIIICKEVDPNITVDYIDFPKLLPWQIEDYVKARVSGLDSEEIKWLCEISKYDIYRLDNECAKLEIFPESSQSIMFQQISDENGYSDLNTFTIFNFTNALLKKDYITLNNILSDLQNIDVEATGVVTIMLRQFKNLIDIQLNPNNTAASLNMNPKQFNAIKYNCGKFKNTELIDMYEFLTGVDSKLKNGELTLDETNDKLINNNKLVDYITINLLAISTT